MQSCVARSRMWRASWIIGVFSIDTDFTPHTEMSTNSGALLFSASHTLQTARTDRRERLCILASGPKSKDKTMIPTPPMGQQGIHEKLACFMRIASVFRTGKSWRSLISLVPLVFWPHQRAWQQSSSLKLLAEDDQPERWRIQVLFEHGTFCDRSG
jgi:hypothetical protein